MMKIRFALPLLLAIAAPLMPGPAAATTLDFESLLPVLTGPAMPLPGPLDGYVFSNDPWVFEISWFNIRTRTVPTPDSGDAAINTRGNAPPVLSRQDGGTFSFQNLVFTTWGQDPLYQGTLTATGYRDGLAVASASAHSTPDLWISLTANFQAVDKVAFVFHGDFVTDPYQYSFVLDNLNVSAVPEPASYALLLGGLAMIGYAARRRARK